jgi:uncharacterized protein (DUF697 family)
MRPVAVIHLRPEAIVSDKANAEQTVKKHVLWAVAAGILPLPLVDVLAVSAIQLDLLHTLASEYGVSFSETQGKAWITALAGNMVAQIGASALKLIPGVGSVIGGVTSSVVSGASTYAIGQVAISHFEAGGTFANLDMNAARRAYAEELERGKQVAKDLSHEKKDSIDKLERLAKLRDKGVITPEEFEEQKKRVLAEI